MDEVSVCMGSKSFSDGLQELSRYSGITSNSRIVFVEVVLENIALHNF